MAVALDDLAEHPEPDGLTRLIAPGESAYSGSLMYLVPPWRVIYRLDSIRVLVVAIHPLAM